MKSKESVYWLTLFLLFAFSPSVSHWLRRRCTRHAGWSNCQNIIVSFAKILFGGGSGFRESFAIVIPKTHCYLSQRYRYDTD